MKAIYTKNLKDCNGKELTVYTLVDIKVYDTISSTGTVVDKLDETQDLKIAQTWGIELTN